MRYDTSDLVVMAARAGVARIDTSALARAAGCSEASTRRALQVLRGDGNPRVSGETVTNVLRVLQRRPDE